MTQRTRLPGRRPALLGERIKGGVTVTARGCWVWQKSRNNAGYGQMWTGSRSDGTRKFRQVHIVSYETFVGAIPEGMVLDHLCRVPACANPEHLEAVTQNENLDRGRSARANTVQRTRVPSRGHQLPFGQGSFYFREADQRWVGTVEAGRTERGTRRRITVTDRDEDAAWAKLQRRLVEARRDVA